MEVRRRRTSTTKDYGSSTALDLDQEPQPERQERASRIVRALLAALATVASALIVAGQLMQKAPILPTTDSLRMTFAATATSAASPRASPAQSPDLAIVLAGLSSELKFTPLLPAPVQSGASAQAHGCGVATSSCLTIFWGSGAPVPRVEMLEGPAGCCLDGVRTDAHRISDVAIVAGVWAHWEDLDARFGGPILWWVDRSTMNSV